MFRWLAFLLAFTAFTLWPLIPEAAAQAAQKKLDILLDGRTYAPVRAIGESLGTKVDWSGKVVILTGQTPAEAKSDTVTLTDMTGRKVTLPRSA